MRKRDYTIKEIERKKDCQWLDLTQDRTSARPYVGGGGVVFR